MSASEPPHHHVRTEAPDKKPLTAALLMTCRALKAFVGVRAGKAGRPGSALQVSNRVSFFTFLARAASSSVLYTAEGLKALARGGWWL